ncbi:hypothetical protein ACWGBX_33530 [Streptomyces sp. NPDC055037]
MRSSEKSGTTPRRPVSASKATAWTRPASSGAADDTIPERS